MRRMQVQADATDRSMAKLAVTSDLVGNRKQQSQIDQMGRNYRTYGRAVDDAGYSMDRTGQRSRNLTRDLEKQDSRWQRLKRSLGETGTALAGFGKIFALAKMPAMIAGVGLLAQGVGALAGGVIGLVPRLADLGGGFLALGVPITGLVSGLGVLKFAMSGISSALAGNTQALSRLTPQARGFVAILKTYHGVVRQLRENAQVGLFAGLDKAIPQLSTAIPQVNSVLRAVGGQLGSFFLNVSRQVTKTPFLSDMLGIGHAGARFIGFAGKGFQSLLDIFRQLTAGAIPFADRMGHAFDGFMKRVDRWTIFQRDSGRLNNILNRAASSAHMLGEVFHNLWGWFSALGRAARAMFLWQDIERATKRWSDYANSIRGQVNLTRDFVSMRAGVHEIVTLFDDLVRAVFSMGTSKGLPGMVSMIDKLIPLVKTLLDYMTNTFGPPVIAFLSSLVKAVGALTGATGPFTILLTLASKILDVFTKLIQIIPGFSSIATTALTFVGMAFAIRKVQGLAAAWFGVGAAAKGAAAAEGAAMALGGGVGFGGGRGAGRGAGLAGAAEQGFLLRSITRPYARSAFGAIEGEAANTFQFGVRPAFYTSGGEGALLAEGAGVFGAARLGALGSRASALAGAAGKFAWPLALAMGAYGGFTAPRSGSFGHQAYQTYEGAVNGLTGGLFGKGMDAFTGGGFSRSLMTPDQLAQSEVQKALSPGSSFESRLAKYGGESPRTLLQVRKQMAIYESQIASWAGNTEQAYTDATSQLKQQLNVLRSVKNQQEQNNRYHDLAAGHGFLRSAGRAFDIYQRHFGTRGAAKRVTGQTLSEIHGMKSEGGKLYLANRYLDWLTKEAKLDPASFGGSLARFKKSALGALGPHSGIYDGKFVHATNSSWGSLRRALADPAERAREQTSKKLTDVQKRAVATLSLLGVSPAVAAGIVSVMENSKVGSSFFGSKLPLKDVIGTATGQPGYAPLGPLGPLGDKKARQVALAAIALANALTRAGGGSHPSGGPGNTRAQGGPASTAGLHSTIRGDMNTVLGKFPGLVLTSGVRNEAGSYHSIGEAVDIASGDYGLMNRAASWVGKNMGGGLLEGIHNPGLSIKNGKQVPPSYWGASTWAAHRNHIHLAAGNQMIGGGTAPSASGSTTTGSKSAVDASGATGAQRMTLFAGIPGTFADQLGALTIGKRAVSKIASAGAGGGGRGAGGGGGSWTGGAMSANAVKALLGQAGFTGGQIPNFLGIARAESGLRPGALNNNPSTMDYSVGLFQENFYKSLGPARTQRYAPRFGLSGSMAPNKFVHWLQGHPLAQAKIARDMYLSSGYAPWKGDAYVSAHHLTGGPKWYGRGGEFFTRTPQLIGVGDNPRGEHVKITPGGVASTSTRPIELSVHIGKIEHHGEGDIRKVVYEEFEALAAQLRRTNLFDDSETHS